MLGLDSLHLPGRNNPIYLEGTVPIADSAAKELGLKPGQIIQAVVEARGQTLSMLINGKNFDLPPHLSVHHGTILYYRAIFNNKGIFLKNINLASNSENNIPKNNLDPRTLSILFRGPQPSMLLKIFQPGFLSGILSNANSSLFKIYNQSILSRENLNPRAIKNLVVNSGMFTESNIANGLIPSNIDKKVFFRQIMLSMIGNNTQNFLSTLDRGVQDIEAAQIDAIQAQNNKEFSLNLVLPFKDSEPYEMSFFRPAPKDENDNPPFTVNLHTDSEKIGEVWLKTSISNKTTVDLIMWAIKPEIADLARKSSPQLSIDLENSGLKMNSMVVYNSEKPNLPDRWSSPGTVINVQA